MSSTANVAPPLSIDKRVRLSIMMFLQFAVWGAWYVVFYAYLEGLKFNPTDAGWIFSTMALGAIFSMLFVGSLADRYFSSERIMAFCHLVGAGLLYWMAQIQSPSQFWPLFLVSLGYALLYNPTLALANTVTFTHVPDATRDFPGVRVLGTIGWIVAGFLIDMLFVRTLLLPEGGEKVLPASSTNGPLLLAAGLSAVMGVYCLFLPHTPPANKLGDSIPFLKALRLFKDYSFLVFFTVSFVITIVLAFYFTVTSTFLEWGAGVANTGRTMSIGQFAELILLPLLPFFLRRFGMKWVLSVGMLAWGIRYALFAFGGSSGFPFVLVLLGIALHGVCFDFFFAAGFIHVDNEAPRDIRASGQSLYSFLNYGVGMFLGSLLAGKVKDWCTINAEEKLVDWTKFWMVPSIGVLVSLLVFLVFFRSHVPGEQPQSKGMKEAA